MTCRPVMFAAVAGVLAAAPNALAQSLTCLLPGAAARIDLGRETGDISASGPLLSSQLDLAVSVYDLADPLSPALVSGFTLDDLFDPGQTSQFVWPPASLGPGFAVFGISYVHPTLADLRTTYYAVDLTDPASPAPVGVIGTSTDGRVEIFESTACLVTRFALKLVDLSDPGSPVSASFAGFSRVSGVAVRGDLLFVCDSDFCAAPPSTFCFDGRGLWVLDTSDPDDPEAVFNDPDLIDLSHFAFHGDHLLAAHPSGLVVLDIADPSSTHRVGLLPGLSPRSIHVRGNAAIIDDAALGTVVVDLTDPTSPSVIQIGATSGPLAGFTTDYAYAPAGLTLDAYDLDGLVNPTPPLSAQLDTPGQTREIAIVGDTALLADVNGGVQIADVSGPLLPVLLPPFAAAGPVFGVHAEGGRAYVAAGAGGLQILDITDPRSPSSLGVFDTPGIAQDVNVAGGFAYVANGPAFETQIVSVADPGSPALVGPIPHPDTGTLRSKDLTVRGTTLYAAAADRGFAVYDVTDPESPSLLTTVSNIGLIDAVTLMGDLALLASPDGFVRVYDVADPATPVLRSTINTLGQPREIAAWGTIAFIADDTAGVLAFDLADPTSPRALHLFHINNRATNVAVANGRLFVSDDNAGMLVVSLPTDCGQCVADRNGDSIADLADISLYVTDFLNASPSADLNADGFTDFSDIEAFVEAFLAGC